MNAALDHRSALPDGTVLRAQEVRLRLAPGRWAYADENRDAIARGWALRLAANPALFNGRFFILTEWRLADGVLDGACLETDYASFLHWRAAGWPGEGQNAFAMPAVHAACGRLLIGRMAAWTANAGRWYPPAGSLEPADLTPDGGFDLLGNMRRELAEEIGLTIAESDFEPGWTIVVMRGRMAMFRGVRLADSADSADALRPRFAAHLAAEARPELDALRFVADAAECESLDVPAFVLTYLASLRTA